MRDPLLCTAAGLGVLLCLTSPACDPDPSGAPTGGPFHVYLTWRGDASTTMTVNYHTSAQATESVVLLDRVSRRGVPSRYARRVLGTRHRIEGVEGRWIHVVDVEGLEPGGLYHFIAGDDEHGFSEERRFRTLPGGRAPLRFVAGGGVGVGRRARRLLRQAARQNPAFALIGGGIARAGGRPENIQRWDRWLSNWEEIMVTAGGVMVPLIVAVGDGEVNDVDGPPRRRAPLYYGLFAQSERTYFSVRLGTEAVLLVLDSGAVVPHGGEQATWLRNEMERTAELPVKLATYHHPLFPGNDDYYHPRAIDGREHWLPVFDRYGLTAAFEHHDRVLKRSVPLRRYREAPGGTVYLGDGAFGLAARALDGPRPWYLDRRKSVCHFWAVDLDRGHVRCRAVGEAGLILDVVRLSGAGAAVHDPLNAALAWSAALDSGAP